MTRRELIDNIISATEPIYGPREAAAIARLVAEKRYGLSRTDVALDPHREVELKPEDTTSCDPSTKADGNATFNFQLSTFNSLLADLAAARPVQYILGTADFDGMELAVGEGVLIPRPETEELVRWIITNYELRITNGLRKKERPNILDIGTGSGAIAIALARRLPGAHVAAIDISPEALKFARANNEKYSAGVTFHEADILGFEKSSLSTFNFPNRALLAWPSQELSTNFDVIVSNPPYIPASERAQMAANVAEWEPETALFVPDDDPLVFYRAIARFARKRLSPGGALWFEIHESAASEVVELLAAEGFKEIELRDDINGKPRMVKCSVDSSSAFRLARNGNQKCHPDGAEGEEESTL